MTCPVCYHVLELTSVLKTVQKEAQRLTDFRCINCGTLLQVKITILAGPTRKNFSRNLPEQGPSKEEKLWPKIQPASKKG